MCYECILVFIYPPPLCVLLPFLSTIFARIQSKPLMTLTCKAFSTMWRPRLITPRNPLTLVSMKTPTQILCNLPLLAIPIPIQRDHPCVQLWPGLPYSDWRQYGASPAALDGRPTNTSCHCPYSPMQPVVRPCRLHPDRLATHCILQHLLSCISLPTLINSFVRPRF